MTTLITCALPYANGPIHLGHMVEHIQTDIYVRFLRSCGEDVVFLCADDTHGTPIELNAQKQGVTPEAFIGQWHVEHQRDFSDFDVKFDTFHSTHSPENRQWAELIYNRLKDAGMIARRDVEQAFDPKANRFLPDRFIRGTCPNCNTADQYGDACEKCGATYGPKELKDPKSVITGEAPVWKSSAHLFFTLSKQEAFLKETLASSAFIAPSLAAQLQQFFAKGLSDWDISRDGPYFGFEIPGEKDKFFYVWLDAPIGYIATTEVWARQSGRAKDAMALWGEDSKARIIHFIGKDIVYFHALFWPAVLKVAGLKRPDRVHVHGHLTVNGEKMSKSRGTFINARPYLDRFDPSYLRFFYATMLGSGPEDLDLSLKEFRERVNAELVNNLGNLANRSLSLLATPALGKKLAPASASDGRKVVEAALAMVPEIRAAFARLDYRAGMKGILDIGSMANQFLTQHEPWKKVRNAETAEAAREVLSDAAEVTYLVAALLQPVVPRLSDKLFAQLGAPSLSYAALEKATYPLLDRKKPIGEPSPIIGRMEEAQFEGLVVAPEAAAAPKAAPPKAAVEAAPPADIEYADFAKVALKVGKVLSAERIPKADKLLKLTVDVGEGAPRTIAAGIAEAYAPEALVGKHVVVVANLKAKALRGIESKGMLLAAGPGGKQLVLVDPGVMPPGTEVK